MTLTQFIRKNKEEIDKVIKRDNTNCNLNNEERRLWILNDEGLYNWARSEDVNI